MKVVAIVQARMGSSRLPGKVMEPLNEEPMIGILLKRLSRAKMLDSIIVATTTDPRNIPLTEYISTIGYEYVQGSEDDVLSRYILAAEATKADIIVRITADCPLVDPLLVDDVVADFLRANVEYFSNSTPPTFPDGLDVEVFKYEALKKSANLTNDTHNLEHVTPYLRESGLFSVGSYLNDHDLSSLRWTVDEEADLIVIRNIFQHFAPNLFFSWQDVLQLQHTSPALFSANHYIKRNEGAIMTKGQKLWRRAKNIIPGGNMLLSKRPEMFLPDQWPTYFAKAKGCTIWDLEGKPYTDMSIMGIGTNSLGYGHPEVDDAVTQTVANGNMSTFNCPEEVYLAEKLVEIHPWADMVRFARSGGEANAIAIRIARAASGKDNVAFCGYHGWHDWYLSANLGGNQNLAGHLLPGLSPNGVPSTLKETVFPFEYNAFDELEQLIESRDIGVVKMEVSRSTEPKDGFLQKVRDLTSKKGIVLIFDECTSGFRETFGGLHKKYGVEPDMAMFGKALGNGYAVTSVIGRKEVMEAAQTSFISSTFWTERIGSVAALKTLEVMEREQSWEKITLTGLDIRQNWQNLANKYHLGITHWGLPALAGFTIESTNANKYKTLITQEMLRQGYLASNSVYVCTEHTNLIVDEYFSLLEPIFKIIQECEDGRDIDTLLEGPAAHSGFHRLN